MSTAPPTQPPWIAISTGMRARSSTLKVSWMSSTMLAQIRAHAAALLLRRAADVPADCRW